MGLLGGDWKEAADVSEFNDTDRKLVDWGGDKQIGIFKVDGAYHAIHIWCSHQKMSMFPGDVEDGAIMCPAHGARFDLRTGKNLSLPAVRPVKTFPLKVEGEKIFIKA